MQIRSARRFRVNSLLLGGCVSAASLLTAGCTTTRGMSSSGPTSEAPRTTGTQGTGTYDRDYDTAHHGHMREHRGMMGQHGAMGSCPMMDGGGRALMHSSDVRLEVQNIDQGVEMRWTSSNPDDVGRLRKMGQHMKAMKQKMESQQEP